MKKITLILLTMLYAAVSSGLTVHMHYCMGEMVQMELFHTEEKNCGNCGMATEEAEQNGCCKDEHKQVKVDQDKKGIELAAKLLLHDIDQPIVHTLSFGEPALSSVVNLLPRSNAPPRSLPIPLYKLQRNFRI